MAARALAMAAALLLPGCAQVIAFLNPSYDAAQAALLDSDNPEFYADARLARSISRFCPRYGFDEPLYNNLLDKRHRVGRGLIAAERQSAEINAMTETKLSAFFETYGVLPGDGDVCAAADAEMAAETNLSALLVPGAGP